MFFELSPLDGLYFGKGHPFSAGFESVGRGMYPPPPSVFYGAFATYYLSLNGNNEQNLRFIEKNLRIKGVYFKRGETWHVLAPFDLVKSAEDERELELLKMRKPVVFTDIDGELNLLYSLYNTENVAGLITDLDMCFYLKGKKDRFLYQDLSDFIVEESKIGIKMDYKKGSAKEGYLYRMSYIRMQKDIKNTAKFVVDVECDGFEFPSSGLLKLGGEAKAAKVERSEDMPEFLKESFNAKISEAIKSKRRFKLVLNTPSFFNKGWEPDLSRFGVKVKLLAAALGKPVSIGGWDMKANEPKVMARAVPAGSVYYYEILDGNVDDLLEEIYKNGISDARSNEGFGRCFVGVI
ncbi:MAG: type III-B CRISPR module-associated protein Cmr3 [Thermosediminibacteraceae bacterium]|nr:type III-B CRISPR module-associated protein Cmr3 [Thermosediminibacteraceae bacterium]